MQYHLWVLPSNCWRSSYQKMTQLLIKCLLFSIFSCLYIFQLLRLAFVFQLFSGSEDGSVRVWDLMSKKCVATLGHESTVTSFDISEDGWTLLTAGRDKARLNFFSLPSLSFFQLLFSKFFCLPGEYHLPCQISHMYMFLMVFFFPLFKCTFFLFYVWFIFVILIGSATSTH